MIKSTRKISQLFFDLKLPIRKWKGIVISSNEKKTPDDYHGGEDLDAIYIDKSAFGMPTHLFFNRDGVIEYGIRWIKQTQSYILRGFNYKYLSVMFSFDPSLEEIPEKEKESFLQLLKSIKVDLFHMDLLRIFNYTYNEVLQLEKNPKTKKPVILNNFQIIPDYAFNKDKKYWQKEKFEFLG